MKCKAVSINATSIDIRKPIITMICTTFTSQYTHSRYTHETVKVITHVKPKGKVKKTWLWVLTFPCPPPPHPAVPNTTKHYKVYCNGTTLKGETWTYPPPSVNRPWMKVYNISLTLAFLSIIAKYTKPDRMIYMYIESSMYTAGLKIRNQ